jgi:hypothetical protein
MITRLFVANIATFLLIIKFGGDLLSNLAGFYYKIWLDFIIKFGGKEDSSVD